ncbi:Peptidase aspartic, putative,Aspartic peptidase domain [Cinara cedri]|uniref:Peptidase aspartic, putative,Aspartic peptidase domain n=1 Tax=Cinara cedri TaxID=506608 RepID=A0A5E4M541_9HEMI|nr:Peptidase aspartic, putative,Aspartic peptidase domain [Cinara cedri]
MSTNKAQSTITSITLLATALIHIHGTNGLIEICHVLLDSGSQSHFISSALAKCLHLKCPYQKHNVTGGGIFNTTTAVRKITSFDISSCITSIQYKLNALVILKITINLPTNKIDISEWKQKIYNKLTQHSINQNTELGWIIAGGYVLPLKGTTIENVTCHTTEVLSTLDTVIQNFWNIEKVLQATHMIKKDLIYEDHFIKAYYKEKSGRYIVHLPFKKSPSAVNHSYQVAVRKFKKVE